VKTADVVTRTSQPRRMVVWRESELKYIYDVNLSTCTVTSAVARLNTKGWNLVAVRHTTVQVS